jgi:hypothetical protein
MTMVSVLCVATLAVPIRELEFAPVLGCRSGACASKCPPCVVLTGGDDIGSTACAPCEIARAWKELNGGKYALGCADAMAIALGEGVWPPQPLKYITDYCSNCWAGPTSPTNNAAGGLPISKSDFIVQTAVFNLNQRPYDGQATLGPWQTMTAQDAVTDPTYRVKEVRCMRCPPYAGREEEHDVLHTVCLPSLL